MLLVCGAGAAAGALVPNGSKLPLVVEAEGAADGCNANKKSLKIVTIIIVQPNRGNIKISDLESLRYQTAVTS